MFVFFSLFAAGSEVSVTTKTSSTHLLVEVHWSSDKKNDLYTAEDGDKIEDHSILYFELDQNGKLTTDDLRIRLNPYPENQGMYLGQVGRVSEEVVEIWYKLGAIDSPANILHDENGRHDTFLVPLETLGSASTVQI